MKILAPTNSPEEAVILEKKGANELYCGVLSAEWKSRFSNIGSSNRREFQRSNLKSFSELKRLVGNVSIPVYFTMNAFYTQDMYPDIIKEAETAVKAGVKAIIVTDINFLHELKKLQLDVEIHIGTGGTTFNNKTVSFYKSLGAHRVVIPRHVNIPEIIDISSRSDIETEIFIMNTRCMNVDGFCTYQHGLAELGIAGEIMKKMKIDELVGGLASRSKIAARLLNKSGGMKSVSACCIPYKVSGGKDSENRFIQSNFGIEKFTNHCGGCALYELMDSKVASLKIVGRQKSTSKKVRDVIFLKSLLSNMRNYSKSGFIEYARKRFIEIYGFNCKAERCYY
ncbi:U32 family peptidase [Candidatus Woesearchaeota archaeon]|nr:U32 family peptidase [Candidatus Woesearchaeota archaeon]